MQSDVEEFSEGPSLRRPALRDGVVPQERLYPWDATMALGVVPAQPLLTPREVGQQCGLSLKSVYRAIERGDLRASKICSRLRVRPSDVDAWVERTRVRAPAGTPQTVEPAKAWPPAANGLRALLGPTRETASR